MRPLILALSLSATTLTFTPGNWNVAQTVTVSAVNDTLREDQKISLITHSVSASTDVAYFAAGASKVNETLAVTVADDWFECWWSWDAEELEDPVARRHRLFLRRGFVVERLDVVAVRSHG